MYKLNSAIRLIREFEGLYTKAYLCPAKIPSIGYGHTEGVKMGDVITQAQAEELLKQDISEFARKVADRAELDHIELNENQFNALVSFAFNVGTGALFSSTLWRYLKEGDYKAAAAQFIRWNKSSGKILKGLVKRREAERDLFLS